jgi:DHA2 family multidrug resistance protein-like MFS transporter
MARDTLGAAVAVARQLPDGLGVALLEVARDAFVQGMQLTSAISAVVAIGIAILAVVMLRHVPPSSESQDQAGPHGEEHPQEAGLTVPAEDPSATTSAEIIS